MPVLLPGRRRQRPAGGPDGHPAFLAAAWRRLPLRIRLVAGFAAVITLVLIGAGAFVYLRVQYALDLRLNQDLEALAAQLAVRTSQPAADTGSPDVLPGSVYQVLDSGNRVLSHSPGGTGARSLLHPAELASALRAPLREDRGALLPISARPLRLYAAPLARRTPPPKAPAVVVVAVRRDQRDEALRELIGQLVLAHLAALVIASLVGHRLARAALTPVERYRAEAARIAGGATGVRLAVPETSHDEVTRLGHTLNDMLTALESALERERRFVQDAGHELRTPLTLLSAELELALRRPRTSAELEHAIRAAVSDTADLIALTDTLLKVGPQPPTGHRTAQVRLDHLLSGIIDRYRTTFAGTTLTADVAPVPAVSGDSARLTQVLTNLLDNAVRHGGAPVDVTARSVDGSAVIRVHDHGPGMDPAFLPHATERFSRADTARTTPGSGLGLSLAEAVVRAHHGELRICSGGAHHRVNPHIPVACTHPATGTTATVLIPHVPHPPGRIGNARSAR